MIFPSEHPIPHLQVAILYSTVSKSLILHLFMFLLLSMDSWILFSFVYNSLLPLLILVLRSPKFSHLEPFKLTPESLYSAIIFSSTSLLCNISKGYWLILDHTLLQPWNQPFFQGTLVPFHGRMLLETKTWVLEKYTHNSPMLYGYNFFGHRYVFFGEMSI